MRFSIIIPVYNVEPYLKDCLDSVLSQTFGDWEAICVDDGSTDDSAAILEEYEEKDNRVKAIKQKNAGTAAARNAGLHAATGEYIFFLDSDDWLETNALHTLADSLNDEDVLCFSGRRYIEATGKYHPADVLQKKYYLSGMEYYNENALLPRDFAFVCVVLRVYRREFLMREKLFFAEDNSYEDNLWVPMMLYYAQTVKVIPDSLYVYRFREGSKMHNHSLERKKDLLEVANRLAQFFIPKEDINKTIVYRSITHHYQVAFVNASKKEKQVLKQQCDWRRYKTVSHTKIRHRINFLKNRCV